MTPVSAGTRRRVPGRVGGSLARSPLEFAFRRGTMECPRCGLINPSTACPGQMKKSLFAEGSRDTPGISIRLLQCVVYLSTAVVLGYFSLMSMMWSIWGTPLHPTHHLALLGPLGLLASALLSLGSPLGGRVLAVISLAALGTLWVPRVVSLVPQHNVITSPVAFCVVAVYFAAVAFTLLYPVRWV